MLKPHGLIALDSSNNMISIFRKVPIPELSELTNCNNDWIRRVNTDVLQTTNDYIQMFNQIVNPNFSHKRSIAAFSIGLGAVDLLLGGIGYGKLQAHIHSLENKFQNFVETQQST